MEILITFRWQSARNYAPKIRWKGKKTRAGRRYNTESISSHRVQCAAAMSTCSFQFQVHKNISNICSGEFWFMPAERDLKFCQHTAKLIKSEKLTTFSSWIFDLWRAVAYRSEKFNENSIKVCGTLQRKAGGHVVGNCNIWLTGASGPGLRPFSYCPSGPNED